MNTVPLVSVVTVVFNDAANIEKTILSVTSQIKCNYEYIIIDGGSFDGTIDIINNYEDELSYIVSEADKGIYHAMNKGIVRAKGKWIYFLNSGDTFFSQESISNFLSNDVEDASLLYGQHVVDYGGFLRTSIPGDLSDLWKGMIFSHQSVFVLTDLLKKYFFDTTYKLASDYDLISKLASTGFKFKYIPQALSIVSAQGISDKQRLLVISEYSKISEKYFKFHHTETFFLFKAIDAQLRIFIKNILPVSLVIKIQKRSFL